MKLFSPAPQQPVNPVLRPVAVFVWAAVALAVTVALTAFLAHLSYRADPQRLGGLLDVVRIGLSVGVGTGGLFALWLATRRQRSAEQTLALQREVSDTTVVDSTERRITDQYSKAIEQLGHEKAAVRLGAIYSLERLAQEHPGHRQTVVDVFCSYLRLPFDVPTGRKNAEYRRRLTSDESRAFAELEVRHTIQEMLWTHLGDPDQREVGSKRWPDIDLDLSRAILVDPVLRQLKVRDLKCEGTVVHGIADFRHLRVTGFAAIGGARFHGQALFSDAVFATHFGLIDCDFAARADFSGMKIPKLSVNLLRSRFRGEVDLSGCTLHNLGVNDCRFERDVVLTGISCGALLIFNSDFRGRLSTQRLELTAGMSVGCTFRVQPERHQQIVLFDSLEKNEAARRIREHFEIELPDTDSVTTR
ncbi:pentapeptide repeat-containing protein [Lentzea sp. NPDC051838]|uniref:pentapeptide repeat-containing protein n=1 Tax=Lentzea sp. NPDC051838 TaxID=3154849 RepID=UPI00341D788D